METDILKIIEIIKINKECIDKGVYTNLLESCDTESIIVYLLDQVKELEDKFERLENKFERLENRLDSFKEDVVEGSIYIYD